MADKEREPLIIGREVISEPGAGITVTVLHLSDWAKKALCVGPGVKIPPVKP